MDLNISRAPLLPERHPQGDFFVCDIFDAVPKGDMASMEHPIFSLSTKPDTRVREYNHNGVQVRIKPSADGLATVHDRDILIYCISQLIGALNAGQQVTQIVRFRAYDLLVATNRNTAGTGYEQLKAALERLSGTRISTNITTGGQEIFRTFGLIESAEVVRQTRDGRMQEVEIKLSDWVFNAIRSNEVLTLHRDYFRLRKPLERRIYELARKHCGTKSEWRIGLGLLQKKCGSNSTLREFRRLVQGIVAADKLHSHMPDYAIRLEEDVVFFNNRGTMQTRPEMLAVVTCLPAAIYDQARSEAPGWDIYHLEQEWRRWMAEGGLEAPGNPEKAFLGFCRKWFERRGRP
jgi:plasmid replication initiation protein